MNYKEMVELASERGHGSVQSMNESVQHVSDMLCTLKRHDKEEYWRFMREQHGILYDGHYSPEFAEWDIDRMHSTDENGRQYMGEHWTREEVKNAMQGMNIPSDVNDCDMWVAANAMWHDMHRKFNDSQILDITCLFFFKDEDYDGHDKIWKYMSIR